MRKDICPFCLEQVASPIVDFLCQNECEGTSHEDAIYGKHRGRKKVLRSWFRIDAPRHEAMCPGCRRTTRRRLCPSCHFELPYHFGDSGTVALAVVGARNAGKTHFLVVLEERLKELIPARYHSEFSEGNEETQQRLTALRDTLCVRGVPLDATDAADPSVREPLVFEMRARRTDADLDVQTLVLFDVAGEHLATEDALSLNARHLAACDGILLLLDPMQQRGVRDLIGGDPEQPTAADQDWIARIFGNLVRDTHGGSRRNTRISIPLAVTLTKVDLLDKERFREGELAPLLKLPESSASGDDRWTPAAGECVRKLLGDRTTVHCDTNYRKVRYFGVAALAGTPPAKGKAVPRPFRIEEPVFWLLRETGFALSASELESQRRRLSVQRWKKRARRAALIAAGLAVAGLTVAGIAYAWRKDSANVKPGAHVDRRSEPERRAEVVPDPVVTRSVARTPDPAIAGTAPSRTAIAAPREEQASKSPPPRCSDRWKVRPGDAFAGETPTEAFRDVMKKLRDGKQSGSAWSDKEFLALLADPRAACVYEEDLRKLVRPRAIAGQSANHRAAIDIFMKNENVQRALKFRSDHAEELEHARNAYGVAPDDLVALTMWESNLGLIQGRHRAVNVFLGELVFLRRAYTEAVAPRALTPGEEHRFSTLRNQASSNLVALLRVCKANGVDSLRVQGSYAGAIGIPQFMPDSFRFWVDGDGDGRIDLSNSADALSSMAHFLQRHGYRSDDDASRRNAFVKYNYDGAFADGVMTYAAELRRRAEQPRAATRSAER